MLSDLILLYVEDDKITQEYIKMILEDECKELYIASDGVKGLEIYKKMKPDIVITDINMPNMDGLAMIKALKDIDTNLPIIIISAYDDQENLLQAVNMGCNGFVKKPINIEHLFEQLNIAAQKIEEGKKKKKKKDKEIEYTRP